MKDGTVRGKSNSLETSSLVTDYFATVSKVRVPALPPQFLSRPRLVAAIGTARQALTLLAAGPGSGKTVALTEWARHVERPVAWLSLDPPDNDSTRFWKLAGEALKAVGAVPDAMILGDLPHDRRDVGRFLSAFTASVPANEQILVIDDAHLITDATLLAEIDAVVRYGYPHLRFVLAARSDPMLPLHRYRLAGWMHEMRADVVAMTMVEARDLLQQHGVSLSGEDLALLTRRTEGWAAGLRLSAMSMATSANPSHFVTQFALDQGSAGEYLVHEVLEHQTERVRRLLIQTSFLDEVTPPLAAAITGIADSATLLSELARTNSFVVPVGRYADRFRYHQLLLEVLRHLLRHQYAADGRTLRSRAANWFAAHGDTASAIRFAMQAGDYATAASVVANGGFVRAYVERRDLLGLGLAPLATADLEEVGLDPARDTEVAVALAAIAALRGDHKTGADGLLARGSPRLPPQVTMTAHVVDFVAAQQSGVVADVDRIAARLTDEEPLAAVVRATPGLASAIRIGQATARCWAGGSHYETESLLADALQDAVSEGIPAIQLECLGHLELAYVLASRFNHVGEVNEQAQALLRQHAQLQLLAVHHLADALAAYMRADLAAAHRAVRHAELSEDGAADRFVKAAVILIDARIAMGSGHLSEAHHLIHTACDLEGTLPNLLQFDRLALLSDLETALGRPNAALRLVRESGCSAREPQLAAPVARALLHKGDAHLAAEVLRPVLAASETPAPLTVMVEALLVSAQIAVAFGQEARAADAVIRATELACERILQPFSLAAPALADLLSRHPEARRAWPDIPQSDVEPGAVLPASRSAPPLPDPLTNREVAILRHLSTSLTTNEIAQELCVSVNTVKTHIAAIYRKLPATGRRHAVLRARQLELL